LISGIIDFILLRCGSYTTSINEFARIQITALVLEIVIEHTKINLAADYIETL
jgi:hypothetical protein